MQTNWGRNAEKIAREILSFTLAALQNARYSLGKKTLLFHLNSRLVYDTCQR